MRIRTSLALATFAFIVCSCNNQEQPPQTSQQADVRIDQLLNDYGQHADNEQYQLALADVDEILNLCAKFSLREDRLWDYTDRREFMLLKMGKFDEALKVALELEDMPEQTGNRKSAWNFLKIVDCYLGVQDLEQAIHWMGKAVYERAFKSYELFERDKYAVLQSDERFQKMIRHMKDAIGLQHPAKNFTISLLDGKEFDLSSQKGKVVLIDFWDVACVPCRKAMPELRNLLNQYGKDGFEIIGISLDTDENLLLNFLKENDIPWKIACSYKGWKDETAISYGINATPSTWLIDRDGILQYFNLKGEELKHAVEELTQK